MGTQSLTTESLTTESLTTDTKRILFLCAHPDDVEAHAGGSVAGWTDAGWAVRYVFFTSGDKGSDDPAADPAALVAQREAEQMRAAAILGVSDVEFLHFGDGTLASIPAELAAQATAEIRRYRPQRVVTHDPYAGPPHYLTYQLHPDHRALGFAVLDAVYFRAPGPLFYPEQLAAGLAPHRTAELFLFMGNHVDLYVDISQTFERKIAALQAHASQWGQHPDLPGMFRSRAERYGQAGELPLAEAFKRLLPD